jgi:hypothetical protein
MTKELSQEKAKDIMWKVKAIEAVLNKIGYGIDYDDATNLIEKILKAD